jgi:hypothetical protein
VALYLPTVAFAPAVVVAPAVEVAPVMVPEAYTWDGGNAASRPARATPEWSQFAGRHGLSLIFNDHALVEDKSPIFASDLHEREVALTPTLQHILEQSEQGYQHWGLNE